MGSVVGMRFEGGKELAAALAAMPARLSRTVQLDALRTGAEPMRRAMERKAPRSDVPPHMADTMTVSNARVEGGAAAVAVGPSKRGFYGSFVEFGTSRMSAEPFARPAFDETVPVSLAEVGRALWVALASRGVSRSAQGEGPVVGGSGGGGLV